MRIDTVVIGGGQGGLALSHQLAAAGCEHVVLERGDVAQRWRTDGWDSLRLVTPNWLSRLPGWSYQGSEPDGYSTAAELVDHLHRYGVSFAAPVRTGTTVCSVRAHRAGYRVDTDRGSWSARHVVLATGACSHPFVPAAASGLRGVTQLTASRYREPPALPDGGVLVVGASASGVQIAAELRRAGRPVVLSAGRHTRVPRGYRGMDIWWWLEQLGRLDQPARPGEPSLQLVGRAHDDLDLGVLAELGVVLAGRLRGADGGRVWFADDVPASIAAAEGTLRRLLDRIDSHVVTHGLAGEVLPAPPYRPVHPRLGITGLDLAAAGIHTVLWATGYRPRYPWLQVPVLDGGGAIEQRDGVTEAPGLYAVGLRGGRRSSTLLDGVRHDARVVVDHLTGRARPHASLTRSPAPT